MNSIFIIKFCCWLIIATKINGEFTDSTANAVRSGRRGKLADVAVEDTLAGDSAGEDDESPALTQSQIREMKREVRRNRVAERRAVRERNRRQRMELRQHRQKPSSSGSQAPRAHNGSRRSEMEWIKTNLSSLWETVRELQHNQLTLLLADPRPHLNNLNETSWTAGNAEQSPSSAGCPPEGAECRDDTAACMAESGAAPCSGRGSCCCGVCVCPASYSGHFCECSDLACPWHNGMLCGGKGVCKCGRCVCAAGYAGEACGCPLDDSACKAEDGAVCSLHGTCECGRCKCFDSYMGVLCEDSLYSAGLCEQLKPCVLCRALGRAMPQCRMCSHVTVQFSPELEPSQSLCRMVHSGCLLQYAYEALKGGQYLISAPARLIDDFKNC